MSDTRPDEKAEEYMPLREVVFLTLRKAILMGDLKPGERLMEIALAQKLGVSRTPIREAIRKLEHEGLVDIAPRRGAQVAKITRQELNDVLEVREALEVLAITKACSLVTDAEIADLKKAQEEFRTLAENPNTDLNVLGDADEHFHDVIYQSTRNRRLIQILNNLREQMYRFRIEYLKDPGVRETLVGEHNRIVEVLEARDAEGCAEAVREHIDNQRKTIDAGLDARDGEKEKQVQR